jgi:uncharacterized protein (DUF697 family)
MDELNKILNRLPVISNVRRESSQLRDLLYERRSPRVLAMGPDVEALEAIFQRLVDAERRGAPKRGSAVASAGVRPWSRRPCLGGEVVWLALGTGDPDAPTAFREAFDRIQPDVVLLAAPAGEVAKGADAIAHAVQACYERLHGGEARPRVLPVALLLGPSAERKAEDDLEAERARQALGQALGRASLPAEPASIVSLDPFEPAERAGIEALSGALVELLPGPARVTGCRVLVHAHEARRTVASNVVQSCAALAITVAVTPIPLSDLAVIAPLQVAMVSALAYIGGRTWDRRTAIEWISSVGLVGGAGFGLRWGAQQLFKLVPGAGNVISAGIAGSGTAALGQAAMAYFVPPPEERR